MEPTQMTLEDFDPNPPPPPLTVAVPDPVLRSNASSTSKAAARAQRGAKQREDTHKITTCLNRLEGRGATRSHLAEEIGMRLATVTARINEMYEAGSVRVLKDERRQTSTGSMAGVVVLDCWINGREFKPYAGNKWRTKYFELLEHCRDHNITLPNEFQEVQAGRGSVADEAGTPA